MNSETVGTIHEMYAQGSSVWEVARALSLTHGTVNYHLVKSGARKQAYQHNRVTDITLLREMAEVRLVHRDAIALHFGVTRGTIENVAKKHGIRLPEPWEWRGYPAMLSPDQEAFMAGTLLGDGHVQVPQPGAGTAQFYAHHGPKQLDYIEWKRILMMDFLTPTYQAALSPDPTGFHFLSTCHPVFHTWRARAYREDGSKRYADLVDKLSPMGLAVWYLDDGTYSPRDKQGSLTTRLDPEDAVRVQASLQSRFGIETTTPYAGHTNQTKRVITVRAKSWARFVEIVKPHVRLIPSMLYKLG